MRGNVLAVIVSTSPKILMTWDLHYPTTIALLSPGNSRRPANSCRARIPKHATAGCHNYHDNSSLYESFITSHLNEPDFKANGRVPERDSTKNNSIDSSIPLTQVEKFNMPSNVPVTRELLNSWQKSIHAQKLINCKHCHSPVDDEVESTHWDNHVSIDTCTVSRI